MSRMKGAIIFAVVAALAGCRSRLQQLRDEMCTCSTKTCLLEVTNELTMLQTGWRRRARSLSSTEMTLVVELTRCAARLSQDTGGADRRWRPI
jgi:hypothetical protein